MVVVSAKLVLISVVGKIIVRLNASIKKNKIWRDNLVSI